MGVGESRIARDRAPEVLLRLVEPLKAAQQYAQVVQHLQIAGIQFRATRIGFCRVVVPLQTQQDIAQVVMPWRDCRLQRDGLVYQFKCARAMTALLHQHAQEMHGVGVGGLRLQHAEVALFRGIEPSFAVQPHGEQEQFGDRQFDVGGSRV